MLYHNSELSLLLCLFRYKYVLYVLFIKFHRTNKQTKNKVCTVNWEKFSVNNNGQCIRVQPTASKSVHHYPHIGQKLMLPAKTPPCIIHKHRSECCLSSTPCWQLLQKVAKTIVNFYPSHGEHEHIKDRRSLIYIDTPPYLLNIDVEHHPRTVWNLNCVSAWGRVQTVLFLEAQGPQKKMCFKRSSAARRWVRLYHPFFLISV